MNLLSNLKNTFVHYFKIYQWKTNSCSNLRAYEDLQLKGSKCTRQEPENQRDILEAVKFLSSMFPDRPLRLLDAGCGDGWTLDQFKKAGYRSLAGIDLSEDKLGVARRLGGHEVRRVFLPEIPFPDQSFDLIYCRHVFEHLLFPEKTLQSFFRILAPGGHLFLIVPKTGIGFHVSEAHVLEIKSLEQITKWVKRAGFSVKETKICQLKDLEFWVIVQKP